MDFDKILFMHWYIWSMLWLIHIIFPNISTELWPLIDLRIMFMLNILWNNWWTWSNLVDTVFRCVLYAVFFLQLQCKKFNAYNITDHLTFCCCRNPGRKNLSRENIWQKQNQSTLPIILGRKHFPTVSSWIKCFYK